VRALAHRAFPRTDRLRDLEDTESIANLAMRRLLRALERMEPSAERIPSERFLGLAGVMIRRTLLDLARKRRRELHAGRKTPLHGADPDDPGIDPVAFDETVEELERWESLNVARRRLDPELRELLELLLDHGLTQSQAAERLGISDRTVRRKLDRIRLMLGRNLPWSGDDDR
jgi:RNA polymerase sigma factor (sigma-70 family)